MATRLIDIVLGAFVKGGWAGKCQRCGEWFIGRKDAVFCSATCRKAANRASKETK